MWVGAKNSCLEFNRGAQMSCWLENTLTCCRERQGQSGASSPGQSGSRGVAFNGGGVENGCLEFSEMWAGKPPC